MLRRTRETRNRCTLRGVYSWATVLVSLTVSACGLGCGGRAECRRPRVAPREEPKASPQRQPPPPRETKPRETKPLSVVRAARIVCQGRRSDFARVLSRNMRAPRALRSMWRELAGFRRRFGPCRRVKREGPNKVVLVHDRGRVVTRVYINQRGELSGLWFDLELPANDSLAAVTRALKALAKLPRGGNVAFTVKRAAGGVLAQAAGAKPLSVASAFKLSVLQAVLAEIKARRLKWRTVVVLKGGDYPRPHFPTGFLHAGAAVTIETLATFMIAFSDNAATDILIARLGKRVVERHLPKRNIPLITTAEMTKLKHPRFAAQARQYLQAKTLAAKRKVLAALAKQKLPRVRRRGTPRFVHELEWRYTTDELCALILKLRQTPLFASTKKRKRLGTSWVRVAFKGGSEPGVLNRTYALQRAADKRWYCLSVTWNHPRRRIRGRRLGPLVKRMIRLLERQGR